MSVDRVREWLGLEGSGDTLAIPYRGTAVFIRESEWGGRRVLEILAPLSMGCRKSPGLLELINSVNERVVIGKLVLLEGEPPAVTYSYAVPVEALSKSLVELAVAVALAVVDTYTDDVLEVGGGAAPSLYGASGEKGSSNKNV